MLLISLTTLFLFLAIKSAVTKSKAPVYPPYITEYFHRISTIDTPVPLRKSYGMRQSSVDFYPGTMNIILSVPHDGDLRSNLPSRPKGACRKINSTSKKCYYQNPCPSPKFRMDSKICSISHGRDINTRLLALALRYELNELFQLKPFVIVNRLERSKIDMNRYIDQGTFGVSDSMHAWMRYHFYVKHARELILMNPNNYGRKGLLLDLHSQEHREGWVELGYLLTSRQLSNRQYDLKSSSLASYLSTIFNATDIISGKASLGHFISKYHYSSAPSPKFPFPSNESYFEWGYTIEEYGRYENFSAIMIESPANELVNLTKLYSYGKALASALHDYVIEIELFESLIIPERINSTSIIAPCSHGRVLNSQISIFLLLFFNIIHLI